MSNNEGKEIAEIAIKNISDVNPIPAAGREIKVLELPPLSRVGYSLSRFILFIISGFIFFLVIFLIFSKFDASDKINIPIESNLSDTAYMRKLEIIRALQDEKKNYRDFILQISQMVLLNLLLPTLTAVLGYIFASRSESRS